MQSLSRGISFNSRFNIQDSLYSEEVEKWKTLFIKSIEPISDFPLLMSGGVDSAAILSVLLHLNKQPKLYTFTLGTELSNDAKVSLDIAKTFNLDIELITIPKDSKTLISDINKLLSIFNKVSKTAIQCGHFLLYLAPVIKKDGYDKILGGTGGVVEDDRKVHVCLHTKGEDAAREYRKGGMTLRNNLHQGGVKGMHDVAENFEIELLEPYKNKELSEYALSLDMKVINYPVQKGIAVRAFPEFWNNGNWYRTNSPLQINGGIRDWHHTLIDSNLNTGNWKSCIGVYNKMYKDIITPNLESFFT